MEPGHTSTARGPCLRTVVGVAVVPGSRVGPRYSVCCLCGDLVQRCFDRSGGDEETRTPDPLLAKEMLCQLSYVPVPCAVRVGGGRTWTRTRDLGLIRAAL